jgi:hypothetical protein
MRYPSWINPLTIAVRNEIYNRRYLAAVLRNSSRIGRNPAADTGLIVALEVAISFLVNVAIILYGATGSRLPQLPKEKIDD